LIQYSEDETEVAINGETVMRDQVRGCDVEGFDIRLNVIESDDCAEVVNIEYYWGLDDSCHSPFWTLYVQEEDGTWQALTDRKTRAACEHTLELIQSALEKEIWILELENKYGACAETFDSEADLRTYLVSWLRDYLPETLWMFELADGQVISEEDIEYEDTVDDYIVPKYGGAEGERIPEGVNEFLEWWNHFALSTECRAWYSYRKES